MNNLLDLIYVAALTDIKNQKEIYVFIDKNTNKKYLSESKTEYIKYDDECLLYFINYNNNYMVGYCTE